MDMEASEPTLETVGLQSPIIPEPATVPEPHPTSVTNASATSDEEVQLEPSPDAVERDRLARRAQELQEEIQHLHDELAEKEGELTVIKRQLGITPLHEFYQGLSNSWKTVGGKWKEVQESSAFQKIDDRLTGWKNKLEESERYQRAVTSLNEGGKKASSAISAAGTKIKESETVKTIGTKTSSAFHRTGTAIKSTGTSIKESDTVQHLGHRLRSTSVKIKDRVWGGGSVDSDDHDPIGAETVVPDEPPKQD